MFFPHVPRLLHDKNKDPENFQEIDKQHASLIFDWAQIVIEEGHVEVSQPSVGGALQKTYGWRSGPFQVKSLFNDFCLWCQEQGMSEDDIPLKSEFCALIDNLFDREDRYWFPQQETCRERLAKLRSKHEPS